jgi:hypothetical protein
MPVLSRRSRPPDRHVIPTWTAAVPTRPPAPVERQSPASCRGYVWFYLLRGVPNLGRSIVVVALLAASMAAILSAASAGVNNPLSG